MLSEFNYGVHAYLYRIQYIDYTSYCFQFSIFIVWGLFERVGLTLKISLLIFYKSLSFWTFILLSQSLVCIHTIYEVSFRRWTIFILSNGHCYLPVLVNVVFTRLNSCPMNKVKHKSLMRILFLLLVLENSIATQIDVATESDISRYILSLLFRLFVQ